MCLQRDRVEKKKEYYNSLFFNFDTIIKRTCESEKIDKRDLVNIKDKDLGARVALLESNLVEQTKVFLEHNKIYLDSLEESKSKNKLILRNSDLLGALDLVKGDCKVDVAPSKCLALLEFKDENVALSCYKELNLRRFKGQVIYCEFAPICKEPENKVHSMSKEAKPKKKTNKIVVKNVPFQATENELRTIFSTFSHVTNIRLPIKSDGTHRGFCFIVLDSVENVDKAIKIYGKQYTLYSEGFVSKSTIF